MLQTVQWIMVKPDGSETILMEAVENTLAMLSTTFCESVQYPYGKRVKGPAGDQGWADCKARLLKEVIP